MDAKKSRSRSVVIDLSGQCSIKLACLAFGVSITCYRYQSRLSPENAEIADHLIRLTHNQRNWGLACAFCTCAT